jgi:tRNA(fMet)-specific endonuclease VapC
VEATVVAIDTNIVTELLRNQDIGVEDELYISYLVQAEVRLGVENGGNPARFRAIVSDLFGRSGVILSGGIGDEVLQKYVLIGAYLKKIGKPVSPNDLWIAAECIALDLPLLTRDKDFQNIPGLVLV